MVARLDSRSITSRDIFMKSYLQQHWFMILVGLVLVLSAVLRLYKLDQIPPSPYWEEVALGYDAYSILQTGRDHHGNWLPLVAFESFGDWKPALYFYSIIPFIKILGLSVVAVRLPSALAGVLIVGGIGWLAFQLVPFLLDDNSKWRKQPQFFSLVAMLFVAINPWAIQFSRGAWEVNLAVAFYTLAVCLFVFFVQSPQRWLAAVLSVCSLVLSMYTYHALRLIAPISGVIFVLYWLAEGMKNKDVTFVTIKGWIVSQSKVLVLISSVAILGILPLSDERNNKL
jgi:4-amino-4-deoxy-L-arabinose transferase-like glycosyltransferase